MQPTKITLIDFIGQVLGLTKNLLNDGLASALGRG
jgi:hypothetical protein